MVAWMANHRGAEVRSRRAIAIIQSRQVGRGRGSVAMQITCHSNKIERIGNKKMGGSLLLHGTMLSGSVPTLLAQIVQHGARKKSVHFFDTKDLLCWLISIALRLWRLG